MRRYGVHVAEPTGGSSTVPTPTAAATSGLDTLVQLISPVVPRCDVAVADRLLDEDAEDAW
jgi:hypothetical protein